jgi:hypothetical protein
VTPGMIQIERHTIDRLYWFSWKMEKALSPTNGAACLCLRHASHGQRKLQIAMFRFISCLALVQSISP